MASLPTILLILAAISMGATVIAALVAFRSQKEASSAIFPIVREEESNRARRARLSIFVWIAITALFIGGWLATLRLNPGTTTTPDPAITSGEPTNESPIGQAVAQQDPPGEAAPSEPAQSEPTVATIIENPPTETAAPTAEAPVSETPLPSAPAETDTPPPPPDTPLPPTDTPIPPTDTPVPPSPTPTDNPTETPTESPSATPTPAAPNPEATIAAPRTPAPSEVRVGPIQFATEITEDLEPVNPGKIFPNGIDAIYAVFPYWGMNRELDFKVVWYHNGTEISREEGKWQWGQQANLFVFIGPRGDGLYKLDLYVNDSVVATNLFEISPYPDP
jgi:hypothetical protein